jgi:hypothetical protein
MYNTTGEVVSKGGQSYLLSVMLGVTAGRGNSLTEVISYLRRSAAADGTHPKGTVYLMKNDDVRSKVRDSLFPIVERELKRAEVDAETLEGTIPLNKSDVQGAVTGTSNFDWRTSGSTILPGAICDNFTSFGGIMTRYYAQTPLTEFLRYGAAGSSGTVYEPYSIQAKFPVPMIQMHYARGCSLAESFYQAVHGPYQLLIVGDPLCQPWAQIPQVAVLGVKAGDTLKGLVKIKPVAILSETVAVSHFELFVEGMRASTCKPGELLSLDTAAMSDGFHELRVVAIGPKPIETQGRVIIPFQKANFGHKIAAALTAEPPFRADKAISITAQSPGSKNIIVLHGSRIVGQIAGEKGVIKIPPNTVGAGPVVLRVIGLGDGGLKSNALAKPIELNVE